MLSQRVENKGVNGTLLNNDVATYEPAPTKDDIYTTYMKNVESFDNPSAIIVNGGTNDIFTELTYGSSTIGQIIPKMTLNMSKIIDDAVERAEKVYVFNVPCFGGFVGYSGDMGTARDAYNVWLKNYCDVTGAIYVDTDIVLESPTTAGDISDRSNANDLHTSSRDGLHFNTLGNRKVAEQIFCMMDRKYLKGLLLEGAATNIALYSQDFSNAAWSATNCTKAAETSIPDPAGGADTYSLTASAANGKVVQSITNASSKKCISLWIKRKAGAGRVFLAYDGGTRLAPIDVTDNWQRVYLNGGATVGGSRNIVYETVTDPNVTIQLETASDAIYVWGAQVEERSFPTSYKVTAGAPASNSADIMTFTFTQFTAFGRNNGMIGVTAIPEWCSEEALNSASGKNTIFDDPNIQSTIGIHMTGREFIASRRANSVNSLTVFEGSEAYSRTSSAITAGQEIGGIMRGQVVRLLFSYAWTTGNPVTMAGYSSGSETSLAAGDSTQPATNTSPLYFNRDQTGNDEFYGYIRDFYTTPGPSAVSSETVDEVSNLVNRW
jgi:hypothetical protein